MNPKLGNPAQACSAARTMVLDGRANGARLIHVSNGRLNFVVAESNALDILRLWHEGVNVGFVSRNGLYTPPTEFPHAFPAGMLYTCGFDAIGVVEGHPLHGRLHSIPAQLRELSAGEEGVRIVGEIRDTALFGECLSMTRTIETDAGGEEIRVTDELRNLAYRDEPYSLLYHVNIGYPFTDEGATIEGDLVESRPRTPWAAKHAETMLLVEAPVDNWEETCYFHRTKDGAMSLVNRKLDRKVTVKSSFKKFVEWKSRASGDYVIGLEPCTSWLDDDYKPRILKPGAKIVHKLSLKVEHV